jgi:thiamine biosynthesis protein ThiI
MSRGAVGLDERASGAPAEAADARHLLVTPAAELHLKSRRTRRRMLDTLRRNLAAALSRHAPGGRLSPGPGDRLRVDGPDPAAPAERLARVFGVQNVQMVVPVPGASLDALVDAVAPRARTAVAGRKFAVRVRRSGSHDWHTMDAERALGAALLDTSAGVDLSHPDVTVRVHAWDDHAFYVEREWPGINGLPLGVHAPLLALVSGGIDSPVAAWSVMRRGSPVDFVHFELECAQTEHTLAVTYDLWARWGAGTNPHVWVVDFHPVELAIRAHVPDRWRQVALKHIMLEVADRIALGTRRGALVTGDAIGQVSSQTVSNLVALERMTTAVVFRPLLTMSKDEIIERARAIGSYDLSARAQEACNLATGPVETSANLGRLRAVVEELGDTLVDDALERGRRVVALDQWGPGMALPPVVGDAGGRAVVDAGEPVPVDGPIGFRGAGAIERASQAAAAGRDAAVLVA